MGVRGLWSLVQHEEKLWRAPPVDERRHLVFDAASFKHAFCKRNDFGRRHGGDVVLLREALAKLLQQILDAHWEVTFVFDGTTHSFKEGTYRSRAVASHEVSDRVSRGVADKDDHVFPLFFGGVLKQCLRDLGIEFVVVDVEADVPVAALARKKRGVVVTGDTDLMIMDVPGYVDVSQLLEHFLQGGGSLWVLDPKGLWAYLQLDSAVERVAFAALCGNDFVDRDQLKLWHKSLHQSSTQSLPTVRLVANFVRACQRAGHDIVAEAKRLIPEVVWEGIDYSVQDAYTGGFDEGMTQLQLHGEMLEGYLLDLLRQGELPIPMVSAALGQPLFLSALLEPSSGPSGWSWSRPLRAAAVAMLPQPVRELVRADGSTSVAEVVLEAPALTPPMKDWPFGLMTLTKDSARSYFLTAVDWESLEEDCDKLPPKFRLPIAAWRYMVLQHSEADEKPFQLSWDIVAVWLLQLSLGDESRAKIVESLFARIGPRKKVVCTQALPLLAAYQASLWSAFLLNASLSSPLGHIDCCEVYDGPFLHAMLLCLRVLKVGEKVDGFELDDKLRPTLLAKEFLDEHTLGLFEDLLATLEKSLGELDKPFAGKVTHKKLKFAGVAREPPQREPAAKMDKGSHGNRFEALRKAKKS